MRQVRIAEICDDIFTLTNKDFYRYGGSYRYLASYLSQIGDTYTVNIITRNEVTGFRVVWEDTE
jgi:hypothetical protein